MAFSTRLLAKRTLTSVLRNHSTVTEAASISSDESQTLQVLRTLESNPMNHTREHLLRFYTMPPEIKARLFSHSPLPEPFEKHITTFRETALLVREPAIDIISYLQQTDYSRPVNKYVIYGNTGTGKTLTLAHIMHYGIATNKILVHVNWAPLWFRKTRDRNFSETREGLVDLPVEAAAWLLSLKHQNALLLNHLNLKTQKDYVWNPREQHLSGTPLLDLISFGIARMKYSCDVVEAVINELKLSSIASKCNCLVVIDGFNAFFGTNSRLKDNNYDLVFGDRLSLAQSFLSITKYDWCNGAVVLCVDKLVNKEDQQESFYPRYLLGEKGFEHLDPFLPVEVKDYTKDEFDVVMDYYKDRMWVRNITKNGERELELLSNKNPLTLMQYTNPL